MITKEELACLAQATWTLISDWRSATLKTDQTLMTLPKRY